MDYKYTELDYAKKIYEQGFQSERHRPTELRLLATYMRRFLDYKPKKLREELEQWCQSHIIGYRRELYYKMINSAVTKACAKGSMLVNIEHVDFYQYELDYINNLHITGAYAYDCKKLLFTLLFKMKVNKLITEAKSMEEDFEYQGRYFKGGKRKYTELKKLAKLSERVRINEDIIHTLWTNGLVTPLYNGLLKLDFMDELYQVQEQSSDISNDIVLQIKDYDSVGLYFDYYHKDYRIRFCKHCGKIFRQRCNKQLYCSDECKKYMKNEKNKTYYANTCSV